MRASIQHRTDIVRSARVSQVEGIFDVPPTQRSEVSWEVDLPLEDKPWQVGLICGPSGCGKSTIARKLFGADLINGYDWPDDKTILDGFPEGMGIKDVTRYLGSVGFSSPPAWLRPFRVLSNGEQFRVTMARVLAEARPLSVVDEFTSVVDRQVAQIGSHAIGKAIRRSEGKFVAVTCHMDVEDWLQPDWIYLPAEQRFVWRSLQRRPEIKIVINRAPYSSWVLFKHHHYLDHSLNKSALCFVGFVEGVPACLAAWLPALVPTVRGKKAYRSHRIVTLPDYQGVGIGRHVGDWCGSVLAGLGYRVYHGTSHPAEIAARQRSENWRMHGAPEFSKPYKNTKSKLQKSLNKHHSWNRLMARFVYTGKPMERKMAEQMVELRARNVRQ